LKEELERLAEDLQSTSVINFLKRREIRHDTHALVEAGYELYTTVKVISDLVHSQHYGAEAALVDL